MVKIPHEGGFKREANAQSTPVSTVQKIVRYAEKDDLLLYLTAAFGIFMPAVMYFLYRTVHAKYYKYQKTKRMIERMKRNAEEKKRPRTVTIFYCSTADCVKRMAYSLAEEIDNFDPIVRKLSGVELTGALDPKAVFVFIVEMEEGGISQQLSEFVDCLDELRYGHRQKGYMKGANFALLGVSCVNNPDDSNEEFTECLMTLQKRFEGLQGRSFHPISIMNIWDDNNKDWRKNIRDFSTELTTFLTQLQYGAFDENQAENISASEGGSDSDDGDGSE